MSYHFKQTSYHSLREVPLIKIPNLFAIYFWYYPFNFTLRTRVLRVSEQILPTHSKSIALMQIDMNDEVFRIWIHAWLMLKTWAHYVAKSTIRRLKMKSCTHFRGKFESSIQSTRATWLSHCIQIIFILFLFSFYFIFFLKLVKNSSLIIFLSNFFFKIP